jgi:hypothetical protein
MLVASILSVLTACVPAVNQPMLPGHQIVADADPTPVRRDPVENHVDAGLVLGLVLVGAFVVWILAGRGN